MTRSPRQRRVARAAAVVALAVVAPLTTPTTPAAAQPDDVPAPIPERPVPVGQRLDIRAADGPLTDVLVVSPGIAVQLPGPTDLDSARFSTEITRLITKMRTTPTGRNALDAARMAPLPDLAGTTGPHQFVDATGKPVGIHVVITPPEPGNPNPYAQTPLNPTRGTNGLGTVSKIVFDTTGSLPRFHTEAGAPYAPAPDVILLHELTHATRALGGFQVDRHVTADVVVTNPDGSPVVLTTPVEELRTLGGPRNLAATNGLLPGGTDIAADPGQVAALGETVRALHAIDAAPRLTAEAKAALHVQVTQTHLLRGSFNSNEVAYSAEIGHVVRGTYDRLPHEPYGEWEVVADDRATLTAEDFNEPAKSRRLRMTEKMDGADCIGNFLSCGHTGETREPTDAEVKAKQDLDASLKAGEVDQRLAWEDPALRELRLDTAERATSARLQVEDMLRSDREFAPSLRAVLDKPGKVLLTGPRTAERLNSAVRSLREVGRGVVTDPAVVIAMVAGIGEAFTEDSSSLDKATAVLMPLPVLGPLLGIVQDAVEGGSGVDIAANAINLLAGVAMVAGQPELSMLFAVASVFVTIIGQIVAAAKGGFSAEKERRDEGWSKYMPAHLRDVVVPALVKSVDSLFQRVQRGWLNDALLARAVIDATTAARPDDAALRRAAADAKAKLRESFNRNITTLRANFIAGIEPMIKKTVDTVNTDESIKKFDQEYMNANHDRIYTAAWNAQHQCSNMVTKSGISPCPGDVAEGARKEVDRTHRYLDQHKPPRIDAAPLTARVPTLIAEGRYFAPLQLNDSTTEPFSARTLLSPAARHFLDAQGADEHGVLHGRGRAQTLTRAVTGHRLTDTNEALWRWDHRGPDVVFHHGFGGYNNWWGTHPFRDATWSLLDYTHTGRPQQPGQNRHMFFGASRSVITDGVETVWTPDDPGDKWLYEFHAPGGVDYRAAMAERPITQDRNEIIFTFVPTKQFIRSGRLIGADGTLKKIVTNPHFVQVNVEGEFLPDLQCGTTAPVEQWDGTWSDDGMFDVEHYLVSTGSMKPVAGGCGFTADPNPSAPVDSTTSPR
ncbi:hypothetical protein AB0A74_01290 [Saccharothrix sp. NPDC042600]|uniref:scabin-related ADP-ribosyltransferase n=1 Tax=Saccharothrix TaxID=2071 RepID=UPI0033C99F7C|nr:hypothetical protein GCM10017745_49670 [Saccharothrix mutabilis subsp. capreolus]